MIFYGLEIHDLSIVMTTKQTLKEKIITRTGIIHGSKRIFYHENT